MNCADHATLCRTLADKLAHGATLTSAERDYAATYLRKLARAFEGEVVVPRKPRGNPNMRRKLEPLLLSAQYELGMRRGRSPTQCIGDLAEQYDVTEVAIRTALKMAGVTFTRARRGDSKK